jgi:hypothetical protein
MYKLIELVTKEISFPTIDYSINFVDTNTYNKYYYDSRDMKLFNSSKEEITLNQENCKNFKIEDLTLHIYAKGNGKIFKRQVITNKISVSTENIFIEELKEINSLLEIIKNDFLNKNLVEWVDKPIELNKKIFEEFVGLDFNKGYFNLPKIYFTKSLLVKVFFKKETELPLTITDIIDQNLSPDYKKETIIDIFPEPNTKFHDNYFINQIADYLKLGKVYDYYPVSSSKHKKDIILNLYPIEPILDEHYFNNILIRNHFLGNYGPYNPNFLNDRVLAEVESEYQ